MLKLFALQVSVHDVEAARDFYVNGLGFEVIGDDLLPQAMYVKKDDLTIILNKVEQPKEITYPDQSQMIINLVTTDLEGALADLKTKNLNLLHESAQECPVAHYIAVADPSGNVIEIIQMKD
ncbi:VOC family protein [Pseudoalteromonas obscura]|uniref:VOC family protein n=1 Tax=Pseudoalteromonas obscura TaxID=3048491 RepID=A0ABT7EJE9_9GAMM|nr:VOC family protein [Pseudoalteromonas sp. P94(2023)]MDK2595186.1 VOC family protein [Pseudoalteromonas sp. P94(2023)]